MIISPASDVFSARTGTEQNVFAENQLKTLGTLAEYSKAHNPESVGLDPKTFQCVAEPGELYQGLNATQRARAARSEAYLRRLASLDWYGA